MASDVITAAQEGICTILGDGCCTYLPSESEDLGNLTRAIRNLKDIQEGIGMTHLTLLDIHLGCFPF